MADTARGPPAAPALTCEPQYTYWQDREGGRGDHDFSEVATLWHVSGDLRASIKGVLFGRLRDKWAEQTSSQGEVIRAAAGEAALLLGAVRRTRDAQLFLLRALTSQTPTSVRNYPEMFKD